MKNFFEWLSKLFKSRPPFPFGASAPASPYDPRDVNHADTTLAVPPPNEFAITYSHPHYNQFRIGICTAIDVADAMQKIYGIEFSPQFIYYVGKKYIDGNWYEGSSIKTMLQVVYKYGAAPRSMVPTDVITQATNYSDYINIPDFRAEVYAEALKYRLPGYAKVNLDPVSFASALATSQSGLQTRIKVGNNFYTDKNGNVDYSEAALEPLRDPRPTSSAHSWKNIAYKGLDTSQKRTGRNTWGDHLSPVEGMVWGRDGDLDYDYATQAPYIDEAWTILPVHPSTVYKHTFNTNLQYGLRNNSEVAALQRYLQKYTDPTQPVTGNYLDTTAANVLKFQNAHNITPPDAHNVGPQTRAALNAL